MKQLDFITSGVCSTTIHIVLSDDDIVQEVNFIGGCPGNLQGISALVKGRKREEIIHCLKGIQCRNKITSCPDQLAKALGNVDGG